MHDIKGMFDVTDDILAFENGELSEDETIELFQHLIDTGLVWELQGMYGRAARDLIREGRCHLADRPHRAA